MPENIRQRPEILLPEGFGKAKKQPAEIVDPVFEVYLRLGLDI
jgi:hypothetical protein